MNGFFSILLVLCFTVSNSQTKTSTGTGNWNSAATWSPSGVPTLTDNVVVAAGHVISVNANAACNSLTIGTGSSGRLIYSGNTPRTLSVTTDILVSSSGSFQIATNSNETHSLSIGGNIINNGIMDMAADNWKFRCT